MLVRFTFGGIYITGDYIQDFTVSKQVLQFEQQSLSLTDTPIRNES